MRRKRTLGTIVVLALILVLVAGLSVRLPQGAAHAQDPDTDAAPQQVAAPQALVGTSFTYQGKLTDGGSPADAEYDLRFDLYDAAGAGTLLGTVTVHNHPVVGGLFTVQLDFGQVFSGTARFLEIGVRPGDSGGAFTTLAPRQELTAAPYALALPGLRTLQNSTSPNLIGGYEGNWVSSWVFGATIGGGGEAGFPNRVTNDYGTVAGGVNNAAHGPFATVGGGDDNQANGPYAVAAGGFLNRADRQYATVSGGLSNTAAISYTTISGGWYNTAGGRGATIGGGYYNDIGDSRFATIGGGYGNRMSDSSGTATIGGGDGNAIGDGSPRTTIGGGYENTIGSGNDSTTIAGGSSNTISADSDGGAIGGGGSNRVGESSSGATIGGGQHNDVGNYSEFATIGGGQYNDVGNYSEFATIGGGYLNLVSGTVDYATIPGGRDNEAWGNYSFAAGRRAKANNDGCFVWGDSTDDDVSCDVNNRWVARASGGVYFYTNVGLTTGSYLAQNGSGWNNLSDWNVKENFQPVDTQELLANLARVPISSWNYKSQDAAIRHVGPMAQDFNALLPDLGGEGETYINSLDADGVALAAIQGLYAQNQELAAENVALQAENTAQQAQIDALRQENAGFEARLAALERGGVARSSALGLPTWLLLGGLVLAGGVVLRRRAGGEG